MTSGTDFSDTTPDLEAIRESASRLFVVLLWVYAIAAGVIAYFAGNSVPFSFLSCAAVAGIASLFWMRSATDPSTRYTISAAMASQWAVMIYAASNTPGGFILEAHMMYFVMTCQLLAYFCWRSILVVSVIPAVHHLVLTFLYPLFVWPDLGYTLLHLGNHVILVVLTATPALWLAWRVNTLFLASHQALRAAQDANEEKTRLEQAVAQQARDDEVRKQRSMQKLADTFDSSVKGLMGSVLSSVERLKTNAEQMAGSTRHSQSQSEGMAHAAERASHSVDTVAAAAEELSSSISEISRRVTESARIAQTAVDEANRTNVTVAGLSDAAQKIGEVVGLINNIASQTNLLALNATIEAARAGEAGKGFAVVASEVKSLANQTAKATDDIQAQVGQMQAVTGTAVEAIKAITGTIGHMNEIAATIAAAVEQQGAATKEIARSVHDASDSTREVSRSIVSLAQASAEAGQASGETLAATNDLSRQTGDLRREVDGFVTKIRSA